MKYLITGGCGFLGSNIAARCIASNSEVVVMDNLSRHLSPRNLDWLRTLGEFRFAYGDIRNSLDVEALIADVRPDVIFHLAGQVAMTTSLAKPRHDFEINALGSVNVLEGVRRHKPDCAVVYSSTNKVYGDLEHLRIEEDATRYRLTDFPEGVAETVNLSFHSPYGCSKGAADQYMLDYARVYGLNTAVFRHSSIYGGRQFSTYDQGWVGWFCQQAIEQAAGAPGDFTISGNGKQVRDVLHVEDATALYLAAAAQIDRIKGQAFNIGGGARNSLSILELIEYLSQYVRYPLRYRHIAARESDQRVFVADTTKICDAIDWSPKVGRDQGLRAMLEWVSSLEK